MRAIFKPGSAYEEINCADFREYDKGVVLIRDEGHNMGYIPHDILSHIEPHSEEEVCFQDHEASPKDTEDA